MEGPLEASDTVVVAVESGGIDARVGLSMQTGEHPANQPALHGADDVGVLLGGFAERAALGDDGESSALVVDVGRESVGGEGISHHRERGANGPVPVGFAHVLGEAPAVFEADLVGEHAGSLGAESIEGAGEETREEVVSTGTQRERLVVIRREVPLRGSTRRFDPGERDDQIAPGGELLEMMTGDVRVQVEVFGDLAGSDAGAGAGVEVDRATGGITERGRDRRHRGREVIGRQARAVANKVHPGILPMSVVEIPGSPMASDIDLHAVLAAVEEPSLGVGITELGVVRSVTRRRKSVRVDLALVLPPEWSEVELRTRVSTALGAAADVNTVDIVSSPMTDEELVRAAAVLTGEQPIEAPSDPLQVVDANRPAQPRSRVNPFTDASTRVIAVASGKGGVGKSSVTTNLSIALAQRGHSVAAVDADVWGFSMPRMLGVGYPPALVDELIIPPRAHGVALVSMGFFAKEDQAVVWRGPMLHKALEQFLTDVYWGQPDYLLIDMPPGTGDVSISIAQFLPRAEVLIVTTPQPAAQKVAQRAAAMADQVDLNVLAVIENMSWFRGDDEKSYEIFGAGGGAALAQRLDVPLLGQIPLIASLREGGDEGRPIVVADPDSEAARVFTAMAERIDEELAPKRVYRSELKITQS